MKERSTIENVEQKVYVVGIVRHTKLLIPQDRTYWASLQLKLRINYGPSLITTLLPIPPPPAKM